MRKWTIMFALAVTLIAKAQTEKKDTTKQAISIGYSSGSLSTLAGAIDKVTEERMSKGLVISHQAPIRRPWYRLYASEEQPR